MISLRKLLVPALLVMTLTWSCKRPTQVHPNHAPVLQSLSVSPASISVGDSAVVTCAAVDPDGDALFYDWYTDGHLTPKDAEPTYTSAVRLRANSEVFYYNHVIRSPDTAYVQCVVHDSLYLGAATQTVKIVMY